MASSFALARVVPAHARPLHKGRKIYRIRGKCWQPDYSSQHFVSSSFHKELWKKQYRGLLSTSVVGVAVAAGQRERVLDEDCPDRCRSS